MLEQEVLKANENLSSLTDVQFSAIVELSKNDEASVLTRATEAFEDGIVSNFTSKLPKVVRKESETIKDFTMRIAEYSATSITKLASKEQELQALKTSGGAANTDAENQQILDLQNEVTALKGSSSADLKVATDKLNSVTSAYMNSRIESEFNKDYAGLKFKSEYSPEVIKVMLEQGKNAVTGKFKPDFVTVDGVESLVFRDAENHIMRSKERGLNPSRPIDLLMPHIASILDSGRKQEGSGGSGGAGSDAPSGSTLDISKAKTQVEADKIIGAHLMSTGLLRTNKSFGEQLNKTRKELEVGKLPMR
jgi:hypothetical protein